MALISNKSIASIVNLSFISPSVLLMIVILSSPSAVAANSCEVSATNPPDVDKYVEEHGVETYWNWGYGEDSLRPLDLDVYWETTIENDSSAALKMQLVPGYRYTFCIKMTPNLDDTPLEPVGDVYLMTGGDWDRYGWEYELRMENLWEDDFLPVEWRDTVDWLPFRDSHAYERVSEEEFSVAIDSMGSVWSSSLGDAGMEYFLVIDGWDNGRHTDNKAAGGAIDVEVLIDVEERVNIPKFTATILVASMPLACLIVPFVLHSKYMQEGKDEVSNEESELPYLDSEGKDTGVS